MGLFRPLVERAQTTNKIEVDHSNDKPFTPVDAVSLSRPLYFAPKIARMLLKGERYVTPYVMSMAATDAEGNVARVIDKLLPDQGWGSTEHGERTDILCDTTGILLISGAGLRAPNVSLGSKLAIAGILGAEGVKASWAISRSLKYKNAGGGRLDIPVSLDGKEAMLEKLVAISLALATNDTDDRLMRTGLTGGALYFGTTGSVRGESARRSYETQVQEMLSELPGQALEHPLAQVIDLGGGHWQTVERNQPKPPIYTNPTRRGAAGSL